MKRMIGLLLAVICLLLCGCAPADPAETMNAPFRFYYKPADPNSDFGMGALPFEYRETQGHVDDYGWILAEYLSGPVSPDLMAPFQTSTEVLSLSLTEGNLALTLSDSFAELSGMDLTVACACITRTALGFPDVDSVSIRVSDMLLNGSDAIVMSANNLVTEDAAWNLVERPYKLYFSDTENRYLIAEEFTLEGERENVANLLLERLIQGPNGAGIAATMPVGTALLSLGVSDGVCSVNLSGDFVTYAPHSELAQRLTILSVTNTLTQLDEVNAVTFYVDGKLLQSYGALELPQLMTFEERAIGPARTGINEADMDIYLVLNGHDTLSRIPVRIQQVPFEPTTRQLLHTLLDYTDQNGYHSPIPAGTELLSVQTTDGCCYLDLSARFLEGRETNLAVQSVCATVLAGVDCRRVSISVEGKQYAEMTWQRDWTFG